MGEHQEMAGVKMRGDLLVVDRLLGRVRDEEHDDVGGLHSLGDVGDAQARIARQRPAL